MKMPPSAGPGSGDAFIKSVARMARQQAESLLREWLPGGTVAGDEYNVKNPLRDDQHTGNFKINIRTCAWSDFALDDTKAKGGDLVSLYAYLEGTGQLKAAREVAKRIGHPPQGKPSFQPSKPRKPSPPVEPSKPSEPVDPSPPVEPSQPSEPVEPSKPSQPIEGQKTDYFAGWRIIDPVPDGSPAPPEKHRDLGTPSRTWAYRDPDGFICFFILRFDLPDGRKETRPLTLWASPDGSRLLWRWKGPEEPRPLFRLNQFYDRPTAPALICEGEKAACAAADLLPDWVCTTSPFGSKSPDKADWAILKGRDVTIWPDRDKPGEMYAAAVARLARAAGAALIRIVDWNDTPDERAPSLEDGLDIANLEGAGWTVEQIAAMVDGARAAPDAVPAECHPQAEQLPQEQQPTIVQFRVSDGNRAMLVFERVPDLTTPSPKDGHPTCVESHCAERLAPLLRNKLGRCELSQAWHFYDPINGCWEPLENNEAIHSIVEALMTAGLEIGYSKTKKNGVVDLLERKLAIPKKRETGLLPFKGNLLNVATGQLVKTTPDTALRWVLPYTYSPEATCPTIDQWLWSVTGGDERMIHYLLCWLAAILRSTPLQKYLHLIGPSRTGKGLFMRLAKALVGHANTATSSFERLAGRFESAGYIDKRLLLFPDTRPSKKGTETFKMLVGNDLIPNERKFGNTYYDAFQGICLVASNESIAFGDHSDALYRRRCVVPFNRVVPDHEIAAFYDAGGEEQLFAELPGLTNKLLAISESEIRATLSNPPPVVMEANHEEEQSANPISRWVFECLVPSPQSEVMLGVYATHTLTTGDEQARKSKKIIEHASDRAFPSFIRWCSENELTERINPQAFSRGVIDAARTLRHRIEQKKTMTGRKLVGVRLRTDHDDDPDLVWFGEKRVAESPWLNSLNEGLPQGGEAQNEATAEPVEATTPDEATTNESSEEPEIEVVDLLAKRITDPLAKQVWSYIRLTGPGGITVSDLRERMNTQAEKVMPAVLELERLRLARVTETGKRVVRWTP